MGRPRLGWLVTMGRRTLLTPETSKRILDTVAAGNTLNMAAAYAGIDQSTLGRWRQRGEQFEAELAARPEGLELTDELRAHDATEEPYLAFCTGLMEARAAAHTGAVVRIREAMNGRHLRIVDGEERTFESDPDWRAAAWFLERGYPAEWGRVQRTELTGAGGGPVQHQEVPIIRDDRHAADTLDALETAGLAARIIDSLGTRGDLPRADAEADAVHSAPADTKADGFSFS